MSVSDADVRVDEVRQMVKRQAERLANVERAVRALLSANLPPARDGVRYSNPLLDAIPDPDAPAPEVNGIPVVADPSAFVEAVRTALHSSATADEFAARVGVIFAETDAPAPEPEAGRLMGADRWWVVNSLGKFWNVADEKAAINAASEWSRGYPESLPHLAIFAPNAAAARKKYAEQVAGGQDATEDTTDALRTRIAELEAEVERQRELVALQASYSVELQRIIEGLKRGTVYESATASHHVAMAREILARAESAEATVAALRALCGEAERALFQAWPHLRDDHNEHQCARCQLRARLAAASRGEGV